jgi:hypothetical protein
MLNMNPPDLEKVIIGSERLTSIFGGWPSFHDSEIVEIHLDRGEINPKTETFEFPILTVKLVLWNLTSRVNANGYLETEDHTLAILQFSGVDNLRMSGFNHQNAIMGLQIERQSNEDRIEFKVTFDPVFGMGCEFSCGSIEVLNATPWDVSKRPPRWLLKEGLSKIQ